MMTPNHALKGMLLALTSLTIIPEYSLIAVTAAVTGSLLPDLDLKFEHRKTLHFPVYYSLMAAVFFPAAIITDSIILFAAFYFSGAAALHCLADYFVAIEDDDKNDGHGGVIYIHPIKEWVGPRKLVRYAGSPEDLALGAVISVPLLVYYTGIPYYLGLFFLTWSFLLFWKIQLSRRNRVKDKGGSIAEKFEEAIQQ